MVFKGGGRFSMVYLDTIDKSVVVSDISNNIHF